MLELTWKVGMEIEGRYAIQEIIGSGGMGTVFRAYDLRLKRVVAIKQLDRWQDSDKNSESFKRFYREGQLLSKLRHQNIVDVFSMGIFREEIPFLVMEYVPGITLKRMLQESGAMPWPQALEIARQISLGLAEAHNAGIMHRDIKPENIMITNEDGLTVARIVDFGLSRRDNNESEHFTRTGFLLGTVHYMAPEIPQGKKISNAVDVYSLSCLLFELLTAEPPFQADTAPGVIYKHCNETPPTLRSKYQSYDWPPALDQLLIRGLEKNPENRITLSGFRQQIDNLLKYAPIHVVPPENAAQPQKTYSNPKKTALSISAIMLVLITTALSSFCFFWEVPQGSEFLLMHYPGLLPEKTLLSSAERLLNKLEHDGKKQSFEKFFDFIFRIHLTQYSIKSISRLYAALRTTALFFSDQERAKSAALAAFVAQIQALKYVDSANLNSPVTNDVILEAGANAEYLLKLQLNKDEWSRIAKLCTSLPDKLFQRSGDFHLLSKKTITSLSLILRLADKSLAASDNNDLKLIQNEIDMLDILYGVLGQEQERIEIIKRRVDLGLKRQLNRQACSALAQLGLQYFDTKCFNEADMILSSCIKGTWHGQPCAAPPYDIDVCTLYSQVHLAKGDYFGIARFLLPRYNDLIANYNIGNPDYFYSFANCTKALIQSLEYIGKKAEAQVIWRSFQNSSTLAKTSSMEIAHGHQQTKYNDKYKDKKLAECKGRSEDKGKSEGKSKSEGKDISSQEWKKLWQEFMDSRADNVTRSSRL